MLKRTWTPADDRTLAAMLLEKKTASEIADALGVTRSAVIGRISRNQALAALYSKNPHKVTAPAGPVRGRPRNEPPKPDLAADRHYARRLEAARERAAAYEADLQVTIPAGAKLLKDLPPCACHWPVAEDPEYGKRWWFCAVTVEAGKLYCPAHQRVSNVGRRKG